MRQEIQRRLFGLQDLKYRDFQSTIVPNISKEKFIGVRCPKLRAYAKELTKSNQTEEFLNDLPHKYYDENLLHAFLIYLIKDFDVCLREIDKFLPYVDNWAVCDAIVPKCLSKKPEVLIKYVDKWLSSNKEYTIRCAIGMLLTYFLKENFKDEYLYKVTSVKREEYYIKMMQAWYFATALIDHYELTVTVLQDNLLDKWTHNKTIQKAIESYRITEEKKEFLRSLRRKGK